MNEKTLKGELLAHGTDNYLHDPAKSINYFIQIKQDNGTTTERWSKNLETIIKDSGVQVGDTIALTELGKEPVQVGDKTFNKTLWNLQKYEPALDLPNSIEHDNEREQQKRANQNNVNNPADKTNENQQNTPNTPNQNTNQANAENQKPPIYQHLITPYLIT